MLWEWIQTLTVRAERECCKLVFQPHSYLATWDPAKLTDQLTWAATDDSFVLMKVNGLRGGYLHVAEWAENDPVGWEMLFQVSKK
jgi:hypothetical protein